MRSPAGRMRHFKRGVVRPIPNNVQIPICDACGETFMGPEDSTRVDTALRDAFRREQSARVRALVDAIKVRYDATLREIEQACAVTPSYLSHVINGGRLTSETLVRLIEAFAVCRSEFERYRTGVATCPHPMDALLFERPREPDVAFRRRTRGEYLARGHPRTEAAREGDFASATS